MQIARTVTFIGQSREGVREIGERAWHDITAATEEPRVCFINMHDPSSARFLCITKAHTHLQISRYLPRTLSLSLSLSVSLFSYEYIYVFLSTASLIIYVAYGSGPLLWRHSPVWQIAENSDESDFENFRSALAVPVTLMLRRCQRICRRGCRRQHVEHVFPHPRFTWGAHRQSQSQSQS